MMMFLRPGVGLVIDEHDGAVLRGIQLVMVAHGFSWSPVVGFFS